MGNNYLCLMIFNLSSVINLFMIKIKELKFLIFFSTSFWHNYLNRTGYNMNSILCSAVLIQKEILFYAN